MVAKEVPSVTMKKIIEEVASLPVDERAMLADSILRSLNAPDPEIDAKWTQVAKRRLTKRRAGAVKPVPGERVFAQIWRRFDE